MVKGYISGGREKEGKKEANEQAVTLLPSTHFLILTPSIRRRLHATRAMHKLDPSQTIKMTVNISANHTEMFARA